jgi:hypothetical protein
VGRLRTTETVLPKDATEAYTTALLGGLATPDGNAIEQRDEADEAKHNEASQLIPGVGPTIGG